MQAHHMRPKNDFKAVPGKCWPYLDLGKSGGEEGIRTPVTLSSQAVYQIQPFHRRIFGVNKLRSGEMPYFGAPRACLGAILAKDSRREGLASRKLQESIAFALQLDQGGVCIHQTFPPSVLRLQLIDKLADGIEGSTEILVRQLRPKGSIATAGSPIPAPRGQDFSDRSLLQSKDLGVMPGTVVLLFLALEKRRKVA